jgi:hypothetical protein
MDRMPLLFTSALSERTRRKRFNPQRAQAMLCPSDRGLDMQKALKASKAFTPPKNPLQPTFL